MVDWHFFIYSDEHSDLEATTRAQPRILPLLLINKLEWYLYNEIPDWQLFHKGFELQNNTRLAVLSYFSFKALRNQ